MSNDFDPEFKETDLDQTQLEAAFAPNQVGSAPMVLRDTVQEYIGAQKVAVYRDIQRVQQQLKVLGNMAGQSWFYSYPVKGGKSIEGPSIKLANDLARTYGNCNIDVRAIDEPDHWIFYARFHDLESGYSLTRAFQQRKDQGSINTKDVGRQLDIAFQIGQSKAIRNVVVNALQTFADFAFRVAREDFVSTVGKNLEKFRGIAIQTFEKANVDLIRVERVIGKASSKWLALDVARLSAEVEAVRDGMATWDDLYPRDKPSNGETAKDSLDQFSNKPEAKSKTTNKPDPEEKPKETGKRDTKEAKPQADELPLEKTEEDPDADTLMDLEVELLDAEKEDQIVEIEERYAVSMGEWSEHNIDRANEMFAKARNDLPKGK